MLHITIICLGKLKETYWVKAEAEYIKRLSQFAKITIKELKEESFNEKSSSNVIKEKEATKLKTVLSKIKNSFLITLDSTGESFSSEEFASFLNNQKTQATGNITILIGGPLGLDQSILNLSNATISLSKMTFTHQMVRVFLFEQIYRAMMIINKRKYHY